MSTEPHMACWGPGPKFHKLGLVSFYLARNDTSRTGIGERKATKREKEREEREKRMETARCRKDLRSGALFWPHSMEPQLLL